MVVPKEGFGSSIFRYMVRIHEPWRCHILKSDSENFTVFLGKEMFNTFGSAMYHHIIDAIFEDNTN